MGKPNHRVNMVFEEIETEDAEIKALKIYIDSPNRDIDEETLLSDDVTLAEVWATDVMSFVEAYMQRQLEESEMNGIVTTTPRKKDMN